MADYVLCSVTAEDSGGMGKSRCIPILRRDTSGLTRVVPEADTGKKSITHAAAGFPPTRE